MTTAKTEQKKLESEDNSENKDHDPKVMSLLEHLGELRQCLFRSVLGILVFFILCLSFADPIIDFLRQPLVNALPPGEDALHFTSPLDVFFLKIKVGLLGGIFLGAPVWIYQFWKFVEPALYPKERKYVKPFAAGSIFLFMFGISFCYFLIMPMALEFLLGMAGDLFKPIISVGPYFNMLIWMVVGFGLVFEAPLIVILLAILDIISADTLAKNRRYIFVGILMIAAIATPPDPMSQIGAAIPMYLMLEIAILIIRRIKKEPKQTAENAT